MGTVSGWLMSLFDHERALEETLHLDSPTLSMKAWLTITPKDLVYLPVAMH